MWERILCPTFEPLYTKTYTTLYIDTCIHNIQTRTKSDVVSIVLCLTRHNNYLNLSRVFRSKFVNFSESLSVTGVTYTTQQNGDEHAHKADTIVALSTTLELEKMTKSDAWRCRTLSRSLHVSTWLHSCSRSWWECNPRWTFSAKVVECTPRRTTVSVRMTTRI